MFFEHDRPSDRLPAVGDVLTMQPFHRNRKIASKKRVGGKSNKLVFNTDSSRNVGLVTHTQKFIICFSDMFR